MISIELRNIVPKPLKEKYAKRTSDIWNAERKFSPGERIKIKAPSGTGKTTFIHIIYKLRHDYEGEVLWNNKNLQVLKEEELAQLRQQKVSIVFQDLKLFANLTARENIELNRVLQDPYHGKEVIDQMAQTLNVHSILDQKAAICSYGEQQRIAIIRALIQPFEWLIMDEPFSHLDNENTAKAAELIQAECHRRSAGFILTDLEDDYHFEYTHKLTL